MRTRKKNQIAISSHHPGTTLLGLFTLLALALYLVALARFNHDTELIGKLDMSPVPKTDQFQEILLQTAALQPPIRY